MPHLLTTSLNLALARRWIQAWNSLCARKVVTGPSLSGEKSTSPGKLGTNGWVVIMMVIAPDTAFPMKVSRFLAPGSCLLRARLSPTSETASACPKHGRLCRARRNRLVFP